MLPVVCLVQQERTPTLIVAPGRETAGGRRLVRVGTLRALVPTTLPRPPQKPNRTDLDSALGDLARTLDEHQWQLIGSRDGLGRNDLRREQQDLFEEVVPAVLTTHGPHRLTVPETARQQARLHLEKPLDFYYAFTEEQLNQQADGIPLRTSLQRNETTTYLEGHSLPPSTEGPPNRLKSSALNYKTPPLNTEISLTSAPTVGALLARVAQTTKLELYADQRLASLPLTLTGTTTSHARAGDVLELLALSVGGTFRLLEVPRQGRAWILTDEQEGALVQAWQWIKAFEAALERRRTSRVALATLNPQRFLTHTTQFGLSAAVLAQLKPTSEGWSATKATVPLSTLPDALADQLRASIRQLQDEYRNNTKFTFSTPQGERTNPTLDPNCIAIRSLGLELLIHIPGFGVYRCDANRLDFDLESSIRPTVALPTPKRPELRDRIAVLSPKTAEEAKEAVRVAVQARLSALWIATTDSDLEPLRAALAAGKAAHLPIGAYVALTELPTSAPLDVQASGATAAFRVPDAPETLPQLRAFLPKVASLPGLAGLAFGQTVAPGYDRPATEVNLNRWDASHFGYTPERRLAFLRQYSVDPLDLSETFQPSFADPLPAAIPAQWNTLRAAANAALLATAYRATKQAAPSLPLWIEGRGRSWFGSWEAESPLPQFRYAKATGGEQPATPPLDLQARRFSKTVYLSHAESDLPPSLESAPAWLTWSAFRETTDAGRFPWEGYVLNLRSLPLERALAVLKASRL